MIVFTLIVFDVIKDVCTYPFYDSTPVLVYGNNPSFLKTLKKFVPLWWARGKYIQTILTNTKSMRGFHNYERIMLQLQDGVEIALDIKQNAYLVSTSPILLCLHGLGGSSTSPYMQHLTEAAVDRGYRAIVYNRRGHGGTSLLPVCPTKTLPKIFPKHCNIDDIREVAIYIRNKYPHAKIYIIGVSGGANLAIKTIVDPIVGHFFHAACSLSNGYDIYNGTLWLKQFPYIDGIACAFIRDLLASGKLEECKSIASDANVNIDWKKVMNSKSLQDIERHLVVPAYGYTSLKEYYDNDSCHKDLLKVKIQLLCISNTNDPFINNDCINHAIHASSLNENVTTIITKDGGHMGWITNLKEDSWWLRTSFAFFYLY